MKLQTRINVALIMDLMAMLLFTLNGIRGFMCPVDLRMINTNVVVCALFVLGRIIKEP